MTEHALNEIIDFLQPNCRNDLKIAACTIVTQLTGSPSGIISLCENVKLLEALVDLAENSNDIGKSVMETLINISADEDGAKSLLNLESNIVDIMVKCITNREYDYGDLSCGVLANLSYSPSLSQEVLELINKSSTKLSGIISIFCQIEYNKKGCGLHLLGNVFANISQTKIGRCTLMDRDENHMVRLLPFIGYSASTGRRKSIIQMMHNCCFEKDYHSWLIDDQDILSQFLLPLAGPDVFTMEENDLFPCLLQYLDDDKTREPDIEIRLLLLEAIYKLCMTKECREKLRDQNVYLIMREYHKWEKNMKLLMMAEDIVNFLIRKEEEILCDDVSKVEVPEDMVEKFEKWDSDVLKEEENEENIGTICQS